MNMEPVGLAKLLDTVKSEINKREETKKIKDAVQELRIIDSTATQRLPLTTLAKNVLVNHGIETYGQLRQLTDAEMLRFDRIGTTTVRQIRTFLDLPLGNPSGISPTEYKVLIQPIDVEEAVLGQFAGLKGAGFKIADEAKDREQFAVQEGILIAVSPVAFNFEKFPEGTAPKPGDRVLYARYAGFTRKGDDGVEYRIVNDRDIVAVLA